VVPGTGYGLGLAWGDYDNDRFPDLYVTQYGRNVLYHNNRDGTFTDVTDKRVWLAPSSARSSTRGDFPGLRSRWSSRSLCGRLRGVGPDGPRYCNLGGARSSCPPSAYHGSPDVLYHNNGDGTFTNVTRAANIYQPGGKNPFGGRGRLRQRWLAGYFCRQ